MPPTYQFLLYCCFANSTVGSSFCCLASQPAVCPFGVLLLIYSVFFCSCSFSLAAGQFIRTARIRTRRIGRKWNGEYGMNMAHLLSTLLLDVMRCSAALWFRRYAFICHSPPWFDINQMQYLHGLQIGHWFFGFAFHIQNMCIFTCAKYVYVVYVYNNKQMNKSHGLLLLLLVVGKHFCAVRFTPAVLSVSKFHRLVCTVDSESLWPKPIYKLQPCPNTRHIGNYKFFVRPRYQIWVFDMLVRRQTHT